MYGPLPVSFIAPIGGIRECRDKCIALADDRASAVVEVQVKSSSFEGERFEDWPRAEEPPRCDPWPRCDLLPASRLAIEARARWALIPTDVLSAVAMEASALPSKVRLKVASLASSLPSKVRLKVLTTLFSALPSKVLSKAEPTEAAARGEGSPRVEEAPAGACFERFRNLALDAL